MIYFDAAFVAKFYLDEPESDAVRARAITEGEVGCCVLGKVEVVSVFHRKWREKARTRAECQTLLAQFEADCAAGVWIWLPASDAVISAAASTYRSLPDTIFLRALDAIHLACAAEADLSAIFTNDRHLLAAAPHFGLNGPVIA